MADVPMKWAAPTVAYTSYLAATLNSLANDTTDLGAEINNEANLCTFMDLELYLASVDLSAQSNPAVVIYLILLKHPQLIQICQFHQYHQTGYYRNQRREQLLLVCQFAF